MTPLDFSFCWHGIVTPDPARAAAFYPEVLGWSGEAVPMGDAEVHTFAAEAANLAHVASAAPGEAPHWNHYLRVDDVDARTNAALAHGGAVLVPPTDIPPGRFSVVASPSGARLYLFREPAGVEPGELPSNVEGAVHWVELWSTDIDGDLAWLEATLGLTSAPMEMPNGPYHILSHGEATRGGAMTAEGEPHWLAWIRVDDVDATVARTVAHGGTTISEPFDVPTVGRMAVVADPNGARFGIITP